MSPRGVAVESRPAHDAFDRLLAAGEAVLGDELLMDPARSQPAHERCRNQLPVRQEPARWPRLEPGGWDRGGFWRLRRRDRGIRSGGRVVADGWFWPLGPSDRAAGEYFHPRVPLHRPRSTSSSRTMRSCCQPCCANALIVCCKLIEFVHRARCNPSRSRRQSSLDGGWFYPTAV
jgi:hypothetical protein